MPEHDAVTKAHLIVLGSIAGLFVWLFADALFGAGTFVFRDAGHYYYPLFQFVRSEWLAGRVPLWNPYENLGVPLAANPTAGVFYPGTLALLLPLDFASAYTLYVTAHVLLAAATAFRLARHWQASVEAAGLAALSYAFSGNVLFQYCNVVFLVGAAWLPAALLAADRMLLRRSPRWAAALGAVLALMTLGGNAEMAYHVGLLVATYALWLSGSEQRAATRTPWPQTRPMLLAFAAAIGLGLAAVQVVPSVELATRSGRADSSLPRTIYEVPGYWLAGRPEIESENGRWTDGLTCRRLDPNTHQRHAYHFSVGPWRLAEYLWPNFSGRQFPVHRRWLEVIPAEGRIWVPSLYMGLVPLVLALGAMRLRKGPAPQTWLSWTVILTVAGSFGWYGFGWLAQEIGLAGDASVGAPVGGPYWLMTILLPGFVYFRYPAKLLVIAALALSMLAAIGWDRAFATRSTRLRRALLWLGAVSLTGAGLALAVRPFWHDWLRSVTPDMLFGPLDTFGAANDLLVALLQAAVVSGLAWWLLGRNAGAARWPAAAMLLLVAVDLALANGWMVACGPPEQRTRQSELAAVIGQQEKQHGDGQPYRVYRHSIWMPPSWKSQASAGRLTEAARWDRDTLFPKYNLAAEISLAEVQGTMTLSDTRTAKKGPDPFFKYFILPGEETRDGLERIALDGGQRPTPEDVSLWHNPRCRPRAWIADNDDPVRPRQADSGIESCQIVRYDPLRVEILAKLTRPGMLVLGDQFYPGWRLDVQTGDALGRRLPIVRVDRALRGARLEAGEHRLIYRYRPASFVCSAAVSAVAWAALAIGALAVSCMALVSRRSNVACTGEV